MADFDSSLPIRTEANGDVVAHLADGTVTTQLLKINADGSIDTNTTIPVGSKIIVTDGTDDLEVNADGSINAVVTATDLDIRDLTAVSDSVAAHLFDEAGAAFSLTNPLPVEVVSDASGVEVVDYQTSAAVAKDASVNLDYTVTATKTLLVAGLWVSGSGKLKAQLLVNGVVKYVGFNSTANPNIDIPIYKILKGLTTEVVRVTLTNLDNQAQDLYSTLSGLEV